MNWLMIEKNVHLRGSSLSNGICPVLIGRVEIQKLQDFLAYWVYKETGRVYVNTTIFILIEMCKKFSILMYVLCVKVSFRYIYIYAYLILRTEYSVKSV